VTPDIIIPYNWQPRDYQKKAWNYWVRDDGLHAELVWHRRSGKDEIALHGTCVKAHERAANYWHMLPLANQVRKAIWDAVNPRTGHRRIDEAFPPQIRENTRDSDMLIKFKNGSTWQCLGSDNYQGAIGATPAGIVYSEWSQANPSSRGFLRPILAENKGWQVYITTPRGKNHAYKTFKSAQKLGSSFAQLLTSDDTGVFTKDQLKIEKKEYIDTYGENMGMALFEQEYYCSFDAAILGAIWGSELSKLEREERFTLVPHDPDYPVFTVWDIGRRDETAIWWYQVIGNEVRIIDFTMDSLKDPDYFASQITGIEITINLTGEGIEVITGGKVDGLQHRRGYEYQTHWLPHDAKQKTFAAKGKSVEQQLKAALGYGKIKIVPDLSRYDGLQLGRQLLNHCAIDYRCEDGFEAIKQYRYEWDDTKKKFRDTPLHDWTSNPADALRYLAIVYKLEAPATKKESAKPDPYGLDDEEVENWKTA
jgi:phage terminase large subunit